MSPGTKLAAILLTWGMHLVGDLNGAEAARENTGLPVGQSAPALTLKDQNGREVALQSLLKEGPVALVFYRSADW